MGKTYSTIVMLAVATGASPAAYGQADFQPGYIVRPAGDTVRGEIDYRDARFNARQCRFRVTPDAAVATFQPSELLGYGLRDGSRIYRTFVVASAVATSIASASFLEVLVDGPASLYTLRDADRADHYYVRTAAFPLAELVQRKVMLEQQRILQTQNLYRTTLAQALVGCPSAQALLPALPYTPKGLAQAVVAYNNCQQPLGAPGALAATPVQRQRQPVRFGVALGGEVAATHFNGSASQFGAVGNSFSLGPSGAVVGGLTANVPLTALSTKLSLELELLYESQDYRQAYGGGTSGHYNYHFAWAYARLPILVRYTFPKGRVRPVIEVGPTLNYALRLTTKTYFTDNTGADGAPTSFLADNHRRFQQGLMGGVGVQFNYWQGRQATLLARYERDTGWSEGVYFSTSSTHFYGLLAFNLSK